MKSFNTSKFIKNFGFTVLEIVIAISVIGILAVIVAVSYFGITNRATESTIKSDLSNALGDFNLYKTEKNKYPTAVDDCPNVDTNKICIEFSGDNQYEYLVDSATNPTSYRLIVTNKDLAYYIEDDFNSPKLLDASAPEFNPAPITAPTTPTVAVTLSSPNVLATASAVTCSAGTAQYGLRSRTNDGTWSAYSAWSTTRTASQTANDGVKYGYQAQSRCYVDDTKISSIVTSAEATYIDPIATPATPTVTVSTVGATTTWSWNAPTCPAGTSPRYQYRYTISPSGYDSGLIAMANTSVAFTTSTEGQTYTVAVQAQCYNANATSNWNTAGSTSYYRPITAIAVTGGNVTIDGAYTVRTFTSSGTLFITNGTLTGVSVLIVGGGGSGAAANTVTGLGGDGGKGGQVVSLSNQSLTGNITVTVGSAGGNSSFGASTANGGGGATGGIPGACVQGVNGANGVQSSISGVAKYYGGGGGAGSARGCGEYDYPGSSIYGLGSQGYGATYYYDGCQVSFLDSAASSGGVNNGGGGGGGGLFYDGTVMAPAAGGSGVVIIRYLTP